MRTVHIAAVMAVMALAVSGAQAHICMWQPMQRGGFDIAGPAENPCYRKVGPCGSTTKGSVTKIAAGSMYTVEFQQNANHFYTGEPGSLVVDWAKGVNPAESAFTELVSIGDYNAMGELTQTNFTRTVQIPKVECDECVLRLRYISNNPDEDPQGHGPTFYQCADVVFVGGDDAAATEAPVTEAKKEHGKRAGDDMACCAPTSFSINFAMDKPMTHTTGTVWYDNDNHFMREELTHGAGNGTTATNGKFIIVSNFSSGDGYYVNVNTDECMLGGAFGLDLWNEWCFGSAMEAEQYTHTAACSSASPSTCNYYSNGDWTFGATQDSCLPSSISGSSGNFAKVTYFGATVGPIDPSMWAIPPQCQKANLRRLSAADHVNLHSLSDLLAAVRK